MKPCIECGLGYVDLEPNNDGPLLCSRCQDRAREKARERLRDIERAAYRIIVSVAWALTEDCTEPIGVHPQLLRRLAKVLEEE